MGTACCAQLEVLWSSRVHSERFWYQKKKSCSKTWNNDHNINYIPHILPICVQYQLITLLMYLPRYIH